MKCPHCGEMILNQMPEEAKEELSEAGIKENLLSDLINEMEGDDIGKKIEIVIAKKKKPMLEEA